MKRVVFMGTPDFAKEILEGLIKDRDIEVVAVVTQPDRKVGRKQILTPPPVKVLAQEYNIKLFQPQKVLSIKEELQKLNPHFLIVAAYGEILPKDILNIAIPINLHASILPKYRGASPIQQTLLNCDEFGGVSAMIMNEGLDEGDILAFFVTKIDKKEDISKLYKKITLMAKELAIDVIKRFETLEPIAQNGCVASYCKKIKREDGLINLDSAKEIYKKFRAYRGWPDIFLENGLKLIDIELVDSNNHYRSGEILEINRDSIVVGCNKGSIKIYKLQPKSKKVMDAISYIVGRRLRVGDLII